MHTDYPAVDCHVQCKSNMPSLPILAKGSNTSGSAMPICTNELTDMKHGTIEKAQ